ncbi:CCA tRNA nucleotidyltransferase [Ichthyobacterium seriolicida]|uniref:tRNA nucleotidyltransferase n=1 Tax=Ichthyobacterium seriolicida TaxID=242600 RepID=A0A1J1EBT9_9FLAO|nr:HD domain-containing protein [Ichthyobacterium seriolicida]BAV94976.1 tRNA nucleotidyltransferase [Ichthyobacterium seriolicida]
MYTKGSNNYTILDKPIFRVISDIAEEMKMPTYVIGGFVRDYVLRRNIPKDIDIVTVGSGIKLANMVADKLPNKPKVRIFKNFGTAMIQSDGLDIEFVGARKESYDINSRKPSVESGCLEDDQNRRDFTINALALSLNKPDFGLLIDPFNGLEDISDKIIKTPLDPDITYSDDPLRMIRAIRFATQLNFEIDDDSLDSIRKNKNRISIVSKERILDELSKILMSKKPSIGFELLFRVGLLEILIPELTNLQGVEKIEGQSHKDNMFHTFEVVDNISRNTDNIWLRWAALFHDIGKASTKKFENGKWTFHSHEFIGSKMVYKLFKRLKMPLNDNMKYVQKMVLLSSRPISISENSVTDSAIRRLLFDVGDEIDDLMTLCEADITTKNVHKLNLYRNNFKVVRNKIKEVEERDRIRNFQPPISGDTLMKLFDLEPCKEIGIIKRDVREAILEGKIPNEYEPSYQFALKRGIEIGLKPKV